MNMKMTNEEMGSIVEILNGANETGMLGYAIARNLRKMKDACAEYLDLRNELFRKYGVENENGMMAIPTKKISSFLKEMGDIPKVEHDVEIYTISEDEFLSGNLNNKQMVSLLWMIKDK